ncbi:UspA [Sesbania bispinosa]|nr:UspA [Sesbania bispinosa]
MEKYSREVADCVLKKAKTLCKNLQQVKVETRVENGDPREVICQMSEKLAADVLVMGSHGYGPVKRAFLGSVSNYCAQNVKCPVLIVKKPKSTTPGAGDG